MKRLAAAILCIYFLCMPVKAALTEKMVALTFDDGPSGRFTKTLLDGLADRNVTATFLLCGYRIEQYPELTQRIIDENHEIGLHGYSHKCMQTMCRADISEEIHKTMTLLPKDCKITFLRPPGGLCSACVKASAQRAGLSLLCWSVDPKDWAIDDTQTIANRVIRNTDDGDVILLHDMSDSSVEAALIIVDELKSRGFRFVTATELAQAKGITPVPGVCYDRFIKDPSAPLKEK